MPSAKSLRVSNRKRKLNGPLRTRARTSIKKVRNLISANDLDSAGDAIKEAIVALDKAAQKGAIHHNNASRRKSRITRHLLRAKSS